MKCGGKENARVRVREWKRARSRSTVKEGTGRKKEREKERKREEKRERERPNAQKLKVSILRIENLVRSAVFHWSGSSPHNGPRQGWCLKVIKVKASSTLVISCVKDMKDTGTAIIG